MRLRAIVFPAACLLLAGSSVYAASWQGTPLPPPSLGPGDRFGATLAIGENLIAVGAYLSDGGGKDSGAVYFYKKIGNGWQPQGQPVFGQPGDQLGFDLAIDSGGTTLLAGAPFTQIRGVRCGAVRRFTISGGEVHEEPRIEPPEGCDEGAEFGSAVAVEGSVLAVGSRGADRRAGRVYASFGNGPLKLLAAPNLGAGDELGTSLAASQGRLVAGAPFADTHGPDAGAVYVFTSGSAGTRVLPENGQSLAAFGYSVALRGDLLVAGAPLEDRGGTDSGAVHRFEGSRETVISGEKAGDQLGVSVTLGEAGLFAGARRAGAQRSGAVYPVTDRSALGEMIQAPQSPVDRRQAGAEFGFAAATRGSLLTVGAFLEDAPAEDSGAAYVFEPAQQVTVAFAAPESCASEAQGTAPLQVTVTTSDGLPTAVPVTVGLATCPNGTSCAAIPDVDFVSPQSSPTIPAGTPPTAADRPYTLATVLILRDSSTENPESFTVRLSPQLPAVAGALTDHRVTILDGNLAGDLVLPEGPLSVKEQRVPNTFEVRLACRPTAQVIVSLTSTDIGEGTVFPQSLVFMTDDWDQPQQVHLVPVDDPLCDGDQTYAVTAQAASADPSYRGLRRSVGASTEDNEVACLSPSKTVCAYADGTVVYTIQVSNAGRQEVMAHVDDSLPPEVSVVTASADSGVATVDYLENSVVWNGLVPAGGNVVITIVAGLNSVPPGTPITNEATVTWVRDDRGTVATAVGQAAFKTGDIGCPPTTPP